jgi:uncharacterized protein YcfJ
MSRLRAASLVLGLALLVAPLVPAAGASDALVGKWAGTFTGDGTGKYTMTIAAGSGGALGGSIEVAPDGGDGYTATFKSVSVEGATAKIAYDAPDGAPVEVRMEATVEGTALKGAWKAIDTNSKDVLSSGTFTGSKG